MRPKYPTIITFYNFVVYYFVENVIFKKLFDLSVVQKVTKFILGSDTQYFLECNEFKLYDNSFKTLN